LPEIGVLIRWSLFRGKNAKNYDEAGPSKSGKALRLSPVDVAQVQCGPIELRRSFSSELGHQLVNGGTAITIAAE